MITSELNNKFLLLVNQMLENNLLYLPKDHVQRRSLHWNELVDPLIILKASSNIYCKSAFISF